MTYKLSNKLTKQQRTICKQNLTRLKNKTIGDMLVNKMLVGLTNIILCSFII